MMRLSVVGLLCLTILACGGEDDNAAGTGGTASGGQGGSSASGGSGGSGGSGVGGHAGQPPPTPYGPLKGLPSEAGPHIAKIEALGDGEWLSLGAPAADPQFGMGRGRSWGGRALVLADDLR